MQVQKIYIIILAMAIPFIGLAQDRTFPGERDDPAQKLPTGTSTFKKQYEQNIKKTRINGVYIPADLSEAFEELSALAEDGGVAKFKAASEDIISRKLHFGLGRWISINWNLEEGSRYEYHLRNLGLTDVDHMIQFTIVSWHRHLLGKDLQVKERVADYQKQLEAKLAARKEGSQLIKSETRALPKKD